MDESGPNFRLLYIFVLLTTLSSLVTGATVTKVEPHYGSLGGETRLTIFGSGFSADQFSQNDDPNTGNKVYLVGESGSEFSCPVHKDGSTEIQIMCYTPERMSEEDYYVKVVVDGAAVPDGQLCGGNPTGSKCTYKPKVDNTPTIVTMSPQSGKPGAFVTVTGKLMSDRYGSNMDSASNGKTQKLLRVYVGPQDCALKDGDNFYNLTLNDEESDSGTLKCKSRGSSVGFFNASFIIESPYGRSKPDAYLYRVSYDDKIFLFQEYTDITSISPTTGSTAGGLTLTIRGNFFDNRAPYTSPKAYVGDTECTITNVVVDQYIECTVAADPQSSASKYAGNRGVSFEYWTSTSSSLDDIRTLTSSSPGYVSSWLDETYHSDDSMDNYVSKMTTYFTPPHTGEYEFQLKGDDSAKLFVDGVSKASSTGKWASSDRMTLQKNTRYLLEVVHADGSGESISHLRAKYFHTKFTSAWTGKAVQEKQTIKITSTVIYDVQALAFNGFVARTHTQEVQTVQVNTPGEFRFGLFGAYTIALTTEMDDSTISTAVNNMPVFGSDESMNAVRNPTSPPSFTFTFVSKRGDFPAVDVVKVVNSSSVSFTVTEDTKGAPDMDTLSLYMEGSVSSPFALSTLSTKSLSTAIDNLFSAGCPEVFSSPSLAKFYESYETSSDLFAGTRTKETEPFCGRYTLKNPARLYRRESDDLGIMLSSYKMLCFAYKGLLQDTIGLRYSHKQALDGERVSHWTNFAHTYQKDSDTRSESWYYTCIDIYALTFARFSSDTEHRVEEVWVNRKNAESDIYVDSTFIGRDVTINDPEINRLRRPAARPNGAIIKTAEVASSGTNTYTVTLKPFECGNQLPLFGLGNGRTTSGATSSPSTAATATLNNEGTGSMSVTRSSAASPPVTGFIDVTYNGNTKSNLNVSLDAVNFKRELETLSGIGSLEVEKSGDCANFDLDVTFFTLPGDLQQMTVTYGSLAGINAAGSITTKVDGGLFYDPITGDMAATVNTKPQVRLYINDVPVACNGSCDFEWASGATPAITAINPATGTNALGTTAVITGTGFSGTSGDNSVTIGGVVCNVTASSSTSITCSVGNGPVGSHQVVVTVKDKGSASHSSGNVVFEYTADISGIAPTTGSLGGGTILSVSGYGFKSGASVTINSAACTVRTIQPALITCVIPAASSSGTHDVVVQQGGTTLSHSSYTYDSGLTATVNSVSPSTVGVQGDTLTISGSSFSGTQGSVFFGSKQVTVSSWTNTQIVVSTGAVNPGSTEVKVETSDGFALTSGGQLPTVTVDLSITNVYPLQGSTQGGTKITITGSGFGTNNTLVAVTVGSVSCDIDSMTNTEIVCQIANAGRVHQVTNRGTDPTFGIFYAFDEPQITINRGDFVKWSWETPVFVKDVTHSIIEVDSPSSTEAKVGGFSSGTPSANGQYQYQFMQTGTFYVWSGYVDTYGIKNYVGTIQVVNEVSSVGEVKVKIEGKEALHNVGGASNPSDSSVCKSVISGKSGCSDALPTGGNAAKFNFAFWTCSTPIINSISTANGTAQTDITITGEGLSTTNCQNEVSFGGYTCSVSTSSSSSVVCKMDKSGTPELGVLHSASVRVGNRGYAILNVATQSDRSFGLIPNIEDIQPTSGSLAGGTRVTIEGFGFGDTPDVTIGGYTCAIVTKSYTQIVCETPAVTSQGERDVVVNAYINGSPLPAECETSVKTCRFTYAMLWTPTVTNISPTVVNGSATLNITGSKLGTTTSGLSVSLGGYQATVVSAGDTFVYATVANAPAGSNTVVVKVGDYGQASGSLTVTGSPLISSVSPATGSIHGEQLITIQGNGFVDGKTTVTLDGADCNITSISLAQVICRTQAHAAGTENLVVTSNSVAYTAESFEFTTAATPTVTSVNPTFGLAGSTLTISGSNLAGSSVSVLLDDVPCSVTSSSSSEIQCTLGNHATGSVPVSVHVAEYGASNTNIQFEYQLSLSSVNPTQGGTAGGQRLTLTGSGFTSGASVTVCNEPCPLINATSTQVVCKTPSASAQTCAVAITVNGLSKNLASSYTYNAGLTPTVTGVSPARGGTGGGTTVTVSGSGFGSTPGDVETRIDGVACAVQSVTSSKIICLTGPHQGSGKFKVEVEISGNGIAQESSSGVADFSYIDVWSSPSTWGGASLPQEGEFIIIPAGMTLLLDTDTPRLDFLLIQGGELIFDDKDVELKSNIIMITNGGKLQVGTESQPFQHKGIITLYGHHRSKELPIYGTKVLAVRNGTLDLHGVEMPLTWTRLASTASSGSSSIQLVDPVEWNVGDEIVIASTGHHHSQSENEKKTITAISGDKRTLTLNSALEATHSGTQETFDGTTVEFRAEVGLLTHNVVVRGNTNPQWADKVEACEAGFNTGEFVTQTCFQGRFGDEIGNSQFGGMILVHAPVKDTHEAQARISYTEVTFGGQAFRLGRYPIHFHLNGDMSTSYVRGCGIHQTFNRAVNIHGTHNTMVEKTVIYNIMGGAFFLEDGIETGNTFQYNLAVFVRESSSLLNDDITPASFWLTNPNNTVQHNAAAGGSHFGYWYRMHNHPEGPSFTTTVCCKNTPLGVFNNNSAHSFGWFGLWIFPDYFPLQGACGGSQVEPAVFQRLFAWNNDKGAETVNTGALQFDDFVLVQNKLAGFEGKKVLDVPLYTDSSPMVSNSLIVGKTTVIPDSTQKCTKGGVIIPYGAGFRLKNVRFVNYADSGCAALRWTRIDGTCTDQCGGYNIHTEQISYTNVPNKAIYAWDFEGMAVDKDGSLTGKGVAGWTVVPTTGTLPADCESATDFSIGLAASMCPPQYKFHRFAFNNVVPDALTGKKFLITNEHGTSAGLFRDKRLSHKPGWMVALIGGGTYKFHFENAAQIQNFSFTGQFGEFGADDYIFVKLNVENVPDRFTIDGGETFINATVGGLDPATAKNGDWEWNNTNKEIKFLVHGRKRTRRGGGMSTYSVDRPMNFQSYKCFFTDCIPPPDPNTIPPATERPLQYQTWEDVTLWNVTDDGYIANVGGSYGIPQDLDDVKIVSGEWVVASSSINKLGTLLLEGVLEFQDSPTANYEINADFIIIRGGRLIIGWPNDPFDGLASIILRGNHTSPSFNAGDGPVIGSKAIAVFGGLDLFGKDVGVSWTQLAATVTAGTNQIVLKDPVTWSAGDEIVIGPTTYNVWQTESFRISAIAADNVTLTLNETLKYKHIGHTETLSNGFSVHLAAPVGLLSRNIKVIGEDYPDLYTESFGARVIVGLVTYKGTSFGGYARLSNVEFYHTGQEGWTEEYDPRFSVSYIATGTVSEVKPSFVSKCSFHNGFNTAVGAFGIGSFNVSDNVVFGSIGHGLRTSSDDTRLVNNLVTLMVATATYQNRFETFNPRWEAGIEALKATNLVLQDNMVTGSERMAYHVAPQDCSDTSDNYRNNRAFSNFMGAVLLPKDVLKQADCAKMSGFVAWKNYDYGVYYQNSLSVKMTDNVLIENNNGIIAFVIGPSTVGHVLANQFVEVANSTFIGTTSSYDCTADVLPIGDQNVEVTDVSRSPKTPSGGMIGVVFPNFNDGHNDAPVKTWRGLMAYNTIGGMMKLTDNVFANYKSSGCKGGAFAVSTNSANDDLQHPIEAQRNSLLNVDSTNKIVYHRPNVGKINSADCVDMDCDALKKALLKDLDGTFLGHVGSVIPQSEFEWGGDPRRGLGYNRVPKEMVTDNNGNRIAYDTLMPKKGVIRNSNCTYHSTWQAYECQDDLNYEMLVIESMDSDTETRRLSPVAILGDGYVDLINGPQDHGWCSGYTCRKRVSIFHALVATDKEYKIHFTGVTPKHMRYRLLNVNSPKTIKYSVWYKERNRLDVFVDDQFVKASNAEIDSNGLYKLNMPKAEVMMKTPEPPQRVTRSGKTLAIDGNEYEPQLDNVTGTNFFDKDTGYLTLIIKGSPKIDVVTKDTIIVSLSIPGLTVDDFFGDNLVENMASFLNIPLNKVRIVNVVSASSLASGRKKRSSGGITVQMEIGDEPASSPNGTAPNAIDYSSLLNLAGEIVNECQAGNVSSTLNISGGCSQVQVPAQNSESTPITYTTQTPHELVFIDAPAPNYEGVPLLTQPKIRAKDISNVVVAALGTSEYPWQLVASIRSGTGSPSASLNGTLTVNSTNGWFNFTDLSISHMGTGYILDFNVTSPSVATNFSVSSSPFDLAGRPLKVGIQSQTSGDIVRNARFSVTLDLRDQNTNEVISEIAWRGHSWTAEASFLGSSEYGSLNGVVSSTFDTASGQAMFPDLNITGFGMFYIQFRVISSPGDFNITLNHKVNILNPAHVGMTIEDEDQIEVKFDVDYNKVLPSEDKQNEFETMILSYYANIWPDVQLKVGSIREGSIVVTFTVAGSTTNVNTTAYSLCESISNSTSYSFNGYVLSLSPYMTVNNQTFYGAACGSIASEDDDDKELKPYIIALIVVCSVLILIMVAVLLVWRFWFKPKTQTHTPPRIVCHQPFVVDEKSGHAQGTFYIGNANAPVEDVLFKDNSFTSLKFGKGAGALAAPNATQINQRPVPSYNDYFKQPLKGPIISASTPRSAGSRQSAPLSVSNLEAELSPPSPTTLQVAEMSRHRQVTPPMGGNATLKLSRPLSPFRQSESPLPPVGDANGHSIDM